MHIYQNHVSKLIISILFSSKYLFLKIAFLVGQYFLYGFSVSELFECERDPCVKIVDCYVSRPMEKTVMMYIMFVLGKCKSIIGL